MFAECKLIRLDPKSGTFWIDPVSGRIFAAEFQFTNVTAAIKGSNPETCCGGGTAIVTTATFAGVQILVDRFRRFGSIT